MRPIHCLLAFALVLPAIGDGTADYPADLSKWLRREPPTRGDDRWFASNYDIAHVWIVYMAQGRPSARLRVPKRENGSPYLERQEAYPKMPFVVPHGTAKEGLAGEWCSVQVENGWIIGFNAGEWGGALWWFAPDGKERYKISDDQVIGFFKTEAGIFALEGLAHRRRSRGQIVRLQKDSTGHWRSSQHVDLDGAPEVGVLDSMGLLTVATHDRLLRVNLATKAIDVLLKDAFWGGLCPVSMILTPSGTVYIGMRHGVAGVEKRSGSYTAHWLIPNPDFDRPPQDGVK